MRSLQGAVKAAVLWASFSMSLSLLQWCQVPGALERMGLSIPRKGASSFHPHFLIHLCFIVVYVSSSGSRESLNPVRDLLAFRNISLHALLGSHSRREAPQGARSPCSTAPNPLRGDLGARITAGSPPSPARSRRLCPGVDPSDCGERARTFPGLEPSRAEVGYPGAGRIMCPQGRLIDRWLCVPNAWPHKGH